MKVGATLRRVRSGEAGALRQAARDLGHELPRKRIETLREFRAGLASVPETANDWAKGYKAALADLATAYEAAVEPELDLEEAERVVRARKGFARILSSVGAGVSRPSELARAAAMDAGQVSRALGELRAANLVEDAPAADARSRPVRLTLLGERLLRRLEPQAPPREAEAILTAAITLFAHLATERRIRRAYLENIAAERLGPSGISPQQLVALLARLATERALVSEIDGMYVATEIGAEAQVGADLELALRDDKLPLPLKAIIDRVPAGAALFVRCGKLRDVWNLALERHGAHFAEARTIDWPDLKVGAIPLPPAGHPLVLVYDSLPLLASDGQEAPPSMRTLIERAQHRLVFSTPGAELPDSFEAIPVDS